MSFTARFMVFCFLAVYVQNGYGQVGEDESYFIVLDSVPLMEDPPEEFRTLNPDLLDRVDIVRDQSIIKSYDLGQFDAILFIFTKAYVQRPPEIKAIPTTQRMRKIQGTWYLVNSSEPYSGKFIDYYPDGKKEGEGVLMNGRLEGLRTTWYHNGNKKFEIEYVKGFPDGMEIQYYENGQIQHKGIIRNNVEDGLWTQWFENGEKKHETTFLKGKPHGEDRSYWPNGKLRSLVNYDNGTLVDWYIVWRSNGNKRWEWPIEKGEVVYSKEFKKYRKLGKEGNTFFQTGDYDAAIKKYTKALEMVTDDVDMLMSRGTAYMYKYNFDPAIKDFDEAISIEPFHFQAIANRAATMIWKFEVGDSEPFSKDSGIVVTKGKKGDMPESLREEICSELKRAVEYGDSSHGTGSLIKKHCKQ